MSLTISEKRPLRRHTGWSDAILDNIASREEAEIYIKAGLREARIGGRPALIRDDIDWSDYSIRRNTWLKEYLADYDKAAEYNNADLIGEGYPPRDKGGNPYELHHIGQHPDSPLAELTVFEHRENEGNYAILHAAVRKAIGQHNLSPLIDFDEPSNLNIDFGEVVKSSNPIVQPSIPIDPSYNPFRQQRESSSREPMPRSFGGFDTFAKKPVLGDWRQLYGERTDLPPETDPVASMATRDGEGAVGFNEPAPSPHYIQLNQSYIVTTMKSGLLVIDQHLAHYRILYEKFLREMEHAEVQSQQELFPQPFTLNVNDASLLREVMPELQQVGFVLEQVNPTTFVINGTPADLGEANPVALLETMLDHFKTHHADVQRDRKLGIAKTMAAQLAVKAKTPLHEKEMQNLADQLFGCAVAEVAPDGKKIYTLITLDSLTEQLNNG